MEKILKSIEELIADPALRTGSGRMDAGTLLESEALHAALSRHHIVLIPELLEERTEKTSQEDGSLIVWILKVRYHFLSAEDKSEVCMTVAEAASDELGMAWERCLKVVFSQLLCPPAARTGLVPDGMTENRESAELREGTVPGEAFPPGRDLDHSVLTGRNV